MWLTETEPDSAFGPAPDQALSKKWRIQWFQLRLCIVCVNDCKGFFKTRLVKIDHYTLWEDLKSFQDDLKQNAYLVYRTPSSCRWSFPRPSATVAPRVCWILSLCTTSSCPVAANYCHYAFVDNLKKYFYIFETIQRQIVHLK